MIGLDNAAPARDEGSSGVPASLDWIAARVDERIRTLIEAEISRWAAVDEHLIKPLVDLRNFALSGGKRLRPAFCHWAYVGVGGEGSDEALIDATSALELLHCFALIHDDVMDGSLSRRGSPSVHRSYQDLHDLERRSGDSRRFGDGVAVLIGDLAFVYADKLLDGASLEAREVFTELRLEVNYGQYLDVIGTSLRSSDPEFARRISIYKSGKYTVERPLHLGAALCGRFEEFRAVLSDYGGPLGEAFQLRDDVLGVFGHETLTGKPVGEDLREGKPTLLYAVAKERATNSQAAVLDELFGRSDLSGEGVSAVQQVLTDTGAMVEVEARIEKLVTASMQSIARSKLSVPAIAELQALAQFIARRRN